MVKDERRIKEANMLYAIEKKLDRVLIQVSNYNFRNQIEDNRKDVGTGSTTNAERHRTSTSDE